MYDNGDRTKYDDNGNIEYIFSPRYGWNEMPKEVGDDVTRYKLKWNFFGNYVIEDYYWKCSEFYRNNFFVMHSEGKWVFNMEYKYGNEDE
jgi:hypothetical protein